MIVPLVSLAETKMRLRLDDWDSAGRPDDSDIELFIAGASRAVLNYIDDDTEFLNSSGEPDSDTNGIAVDVPEDIKNATLFLIGILMRDRTGEKTADWDHGFLPLPVVCILYPYRTPTLA